MEWEGPPNRLMAALESQLGWANLKVGGVISVAVPVLAPVTAAVSAKKTAQPIDTRRGPIRFYTAHHPI